VGDPGSRLSAVVTCKGRLAHLKQTLPMLMALPLREVVVVDYDCPEGTARWVADAFPKATLVHVTDRPGFNVSIARNLGAKATTAPWLLFADVDTKIAPTFWDEVAGRLEPGAFIIAEPRLLELWGTFITARADFEALGGFDEVFQGWGGEDADFVQRLGLLGRRCLTYDAGLTEALPHSDEMRMRFHVSSSRFRSGLANDMYRAIKNDIARMGGALDERARRQLYAQVTRAFAEGPIATSFEIKLREKQVHGRAVSTLLKYDLTLPDPAVR
jgi:glycosyltransferase involved in cell wall biosynthesis